MSVVTAMWPALQWHIRIWNVGLLQDQWHTKKKRFESMRTPMEYTFPLSETIIKLSSCSSWGKPSVSCLWWVRKYTQHYVTTLRVNVHVKMAHWFLADWALKGVESTCTSLANTQLRVAKLRFSLRHICTCPFVRPRATTRERLHEFRNIWYWEVTLQFTCMFHF